NHARGFTVGRSQRASGETDPPHGAVGPPERTGLYALSAFGRRRANEPPHVALAGRRDQDVAERTSHSSAGRHAGDALHRRAPRPDPEVLADDEDAVRAARDDSRELLLTGHG